MKRPKEAWRVAWEQADPDYASLEVEGYLVAKCAMRAFERGYNAAKAEGARQVLPILFRNELAKYATPEVKP